jgi:hypothetical protein
MNESVYMITKIDFDELENRISTALYSKILGYKVTEQEAEEYVREHKTKYDTYRGWDENIYPKYNISELNKLQ